MNWSCDLPALHRYPGPPLHARRRRRHLRISASRTTDEDVAVHYVGMTPDGSKVFFTSEAHLTGEDKDHGGAPSTCGSRKGEDGRPAPHPHLQGQPRQPRRRRRHRACSPAIIHRQLRVNTPRRSDAPWTDKCGVLPFSAPTPRRIRPARRQRPSPTPRIASETATSTSSPPSSSTATAASRARRTSTTTAAAAPLRRHLRPRKPLRQPRQR